MGSPDRRRLRIGGYRVLAAGAAVRAVDAWLSAGAWTCPCDL